MSEGESTAPSAAASGAVGHVSVHLEGLHPRDVPFSFETQAPRMSGALGFSGVFHAAVIVGALFLAAWLPDPAPLDGRQAQPQRLIDLVWLAQPGPGGGGGGGGNKAIEPPRKAEMPGRDKITVPVTKPPEITPVKAPEDELPTQDLFIPVKTMASAEVALPGVIEGMESSNSPTSQGSGSGGGAGTGSGTGIGPGQGSGLGPGWGGGTGGGAYHPGTQGLELPRILREIKPQYTADAMRAKIQGVVVLQCVVQADGTVGDVDVVRSLDSTFGLDQEAVKAAKQWRFVPGRRFGQPVPVLVTIELTFTLR